MVRRRWEAGMKFELDGIHYRVVRGVKGPDDLRLDHLIDGTWRPIHMRQGALLADFFFENEDVLYPPPQYKGGKKYLEYVRDAARCGWEKTEAVLRLERRQKEQGLW